MQLDQPAPRRALLRRRQQRRTARGAGQPTTADTGLWAFCRLGAGALAKQQARVWWRVTKLSARLLVRGGGHPPGLQRAILCLLAARCQVHCTAYSVGRGLLVADVPPALIACRTVCLIEWRGGIDGGSRAAALCHLGVTSQQTVVLHSSAGVFPRMLCQLCAGARKGRSPLWH